jgi:pSer/pThr/pTyr-binding forkhead associated (FHA) protein
VNDIALRAPGTELDDLPLVQGRLALGHAADGSLVVLDDPAGARACFCVDRRGTWLVVGEGMRAVHVNGRPVQRKAMLRGGDVVHVDGVEITLVARSAGDETRELQLGAFVAPTADAAAPPDPRIVLRGTTGPHHGRCLTLDRARRIGSDPGADIRIEGLPAHHARVGLEGRQVVLRTLGSEAVVLVNGEPRQSAVLQPGDQLAFDAAHRFVLEAPTPALGAPIDDVMLPELPLPERPPEPQRLRFPWLLLAALLLAAALSALLLL